MLEFTFVQSASTVARLSLRQIPNLQRISRISSRSTNHKSFTRCHNRQLNKSLTMKQSSAMSTNPQLQDVKNRQIVLLSGGVESSTLLRHVHDKHGCTSTLALFFNYGQRAHDRELRSSKLQCESLNLPKESLIQADISALGNSLRTRGKERRHVPLHHRNGVLLSVAASLAAQEENVSGIWIAISKDDQGWYPSASTDFLKAMSNVFRILSNDDFTLYTPLVDYSKCDIVRLGIKSGVEFDTTWSCMLERDKHCGRCLQCKARKKAFEICGISEGDQFYER